MLPWRMLSSVTSDLTKDLPRNPNDDNDDDSLSGQSRPGVSRLRCHSDDDGEFRAPRESSGRFPNHAASFLLGIPQAPAAPAARLSDTGDNRATDMSADESPLAAISRYLKTPRPRRRQLAE